MKTALEGVRVLDLSMNLPGPYMTWLLVEMGAAVLKVEPPQGGDFARAFTNPDRQPYFPVFDMVNRGKKSIALDLKDPGGRAAFRNLLAEYDIVVEGFRPGVMKALKLDYETISARFPQVIYVSITGYGQTGGHAQRAGHDLNYQALAGSFDTGGGIRKDPAAPTVPMADLAGGGLFSLAGLLAAVVERGRTGKGRHVDISMFDGSFALNVLTLCHMQSKAQVATSAGHFLSGSQPFYQIYETKEGRQMSLGAVEPKFWRNFCNIVDRQDLIDQQFGGDAVTEQVAAIFRGRTQADWIELLADADTCCEAVFTVEEAIGSSLCLERGLISRDAGGNAFLNNPIVSSDKRPKTASSPPRLGQHNEEILKKNES